MFPFQYSVVADHFQSHASAAAVAEGCFLAAASRDRMLLEPHVCLARLYRRQKKFVAAERALVEALRPAPDDRHLETALREIRAEQATAAAGGKP